MLQYLQSQPACDIVFVWWMLSWFVTRHVLFCKVIASAYWDAPNQIEFGWWPERGHWLTSEVHKVFVSLLVILEVSTVFMVHDAANFAFVLDYPEYLDLCDMLRGISRTKR
jgi:acyl-CoA-dependent ceramide synthase